MSTIATFPDRRAIFNYIDKHPGKVLLKAPQITEHFPGNIRKIAAYFANRQMIRGEIYTEVMQAISTDNLIECIVLKVIADEIIKIEKSHDEYTEETRVIVEEMRSNLNDLKEPILSFKLAVTMYSRILRDLADGMTSDKVNAAIEALRKKRLEKVQ